MIHVRHELGAGPVSRRGGVDPYDILIVRSRQHRTPARVPDELYQLRKDVCRTLDLDGIVAGGVIPGFARHKNEMGVDEYLDAVRRGSLNDPTLTFQLRQGFDVVCALPGYLENPNVDNHAALIIWRNPDRPEL